MQNRGTTTPFAGGIKRASLRKKSFHPLTAERGLERRLSGEYGNWQQRASLSAQKFLTENRAGEVANFTLIRSLRELVEVLESLSAD
jgi:hypothetical protein